MNLHLKKLLLVSAVLTPVAANAMEVSGKDLVIYGKIHVSVDFSDRNDPAVSNDGMSISSNSSRLGFKGQTKTKNGKTIIWQLEQEVAVDDSNKGNFTNRNSFIGLAEGHHSFIVGVHDTPFKTVASNWGLFGDSVAERRSILGAGYSSGNKLNVRATNMTMYQFKNKALKVQLMFAVDPEGTATGAVDDNDSKVTSLGAWYKTGGLKLSAAYEDWKQHATIANGAALRIAAVYKVNAHQLGLIFENIDSDTVNQFQRSAMGANWKWEFADDTDMRVQYLVADSADGTSNTGGNKLGLGIYQKLDKQAKVYLAFASTSNDSGAKFQAADGGHGDEVKTVFGGSPSSLSLGIEYKF